MKKEKRVINIPKEQFDVIKSYCDKNTLDMVSWITKNSLEKISYSLENLYDYLESQKILNPQQGKISFKLYPHQKQILKQVYENDRVIFVKSRQIGMTTLMSGYQAWGNMYGGYNSPNTQMTRHYDSIIKNFTDSKNKFESFFYFVDELNFSNKDKFISCIDMINYLTKDNTFKYKWVVAGSPDNDNNLKWLIDNKDEYGFKVFTYPAKDCFPMWNEEKIKDFQKNVKHYSRELECKFN